jgi:hypothetical protein
MEAFRRVERARRSEMKFLTCGSSTKLELRRTIRSRRRLWIDEAVLIAGPDDTGAVAHLAEQVATPFLDACEPMAPPQDADIVERVDRLIDGRSAAVGAMAS